MLKFLFKVINLPTGTPNHWWVRPCYVYRQALYITFYTEKLFTVHIAKTHVPQNISAKCKQKLHTEIQ